MSAIWGFVSRVSGSETTDSNKEYYGIGNTESVLMKMSETMTQFKIDRTEKIVGERAAFSCGHLYVTNESVHDISPVYDQAGGVWFTADCYLYNRENVILKLRDAGIYPETENSGSDAFTKLNECGDAYLAYLCFKAFGISFAAYLLGCFSAAIYDEKNGKVFFVSDHTSRRYLAYHIDDEGILFGTTYHPILACVGHSLKPNREFLAHAYKDMSPLTFSDSDQTAYEGIHHVGAGCYVEIDLSSGETFRHSYWNPIETVLPIRGKSANEYKNMFLEAYSEAVRSCLRARKNVGIQLSGGLDSSSVLAIAAPELKKQGKIINSYTTVPASGYQYTNDNNVTENETENILAQKEWHDNLVVHFVNGDDGNCLSRIIEEQNNVAQPIKPVGNFPGILGMAKASADDECSVVLTGTNGNSTVSYGNIFRYASLCFDEHRFKAALRGIATYCYIWKIRKLKFFNQYFKSLWQFFTQKKTTVRNYDGYLTIENLKKYHVLDDINSPKKKYGSYFWSNNRQRRNFAFLPSNFLQGGYYNTYLSLKFGILMVDPTQNAKIIELCMALPPECFVNRGIERYMIRGYMRGMIPDEVLIPFQGRGLQGADIAYRVNRDWDKISEEVLSIMKLPVLREYLREDRLDVLIKKVESNPGKLDNDTVKDVATVFTLGLFLSKFAE